MGNLELQEAQENQAPLLPEVHLRPHLLLDPRLNGQSITTNTLVDMQHETAGGITKHRPRQDVNNLAPPDVVALHAEEVPALSEQAST